MYAIVIFAYYIELLSIVSLIFYCILAENISIWLHTTLFIKIWIYTKKKIQFASNDRSQRPPNRNSKTNDRAQCKTRKTVERHSIPASDTKTLSLYDDTNAPRTINHCLVYRYKHIEQSERGCVISSTCIIHTGVSLACRAMAFRWCRRMIFHLVPSESVSEKCQKYAHSKWTRRPFSLRRDPAFIRVDYVRRAVTYLRFSDPPSDVKSS